MLNFFPKVCSNGLYEVEEHVPSVSGNAAHLIIKTLKAFSCKYANMQICKNIKYKIRVLSAAFENIYKQIIFFLSIFSIEKINQMDIEVILYDTLQSFRSI